MRADFPRVGKTEAGQKKRGNYLESIKVIERFAVAACGAELYELDEACKRSFHCDIMLQSWSDLNDHQNHTVSLPARRPSTHQNEDESKFVAEAHAK